MTQLKLGDTPWSTGSAEVLFDFDDDPDFSLVTAVHCRLGSVSAVTFEALLDTGAEWSVIGHDLAGCLSADEIHATGSDPLPLRSRWGRKYGRLHELDIVLPAIDGDDLLVPATVLVIGPDSPPEPDPANTWPGPVVLGSKGFLERIRFALDPGVAAHTARIFFGATQG